MTEKINRIQDLKFESPELAKLLEQKKKLKRGHNWEEETHWLYQMIAKRYFKIDEKIQSERRRMAREAGLLLKDPSGLHCDNHPDTEVYSVKSGYSLGGKHGDYLLYFCKPCSKNYYDSHISLYEKCLLEVSRNPNSGFFSAATYKADIEDFEKRQARLDQGNFVIKDSYDSVAMEGLGYYCLSCNGVVKGEPEYNWRSNKCSIDCHICGEQIGYRYKRDIK
jgi:hypothetical protein